MHHLAFTSSRAESDVPPEALFSGDSIYGTPVHNRTYLKSSRTTAIPDTVMALPLINQSALGGIKDPGRGRHGTTAAIFWFYFPKAGIGCPLLIWRLGSLPGGLAWEALFVGVASMPNSPFILRAIGPRAAPHVPIWSKLSRTAPCHYRYAPTLYVLRQLPGPPIISDEMTPPNGHVMTTSREAGGSL